MTSRHYLQSIGQTLKDNWLRYLAEIIVVCLCLMFIYHYVSIPRYRQFVSVHSSQEAILRRGEYQHSPKLEYDFTYRQGCPHCMSVQSTVAPLLAKDSKHHDNLLVLNAKDTKIKHYLISSGQEDVPTTSIRYHGYLLYQYTGTNKKTLSELLHGINPETHHHFKRTIPRISIISNSLHNNHHYSKVPARDTLNY